MLNGWILLLLLSLPVFSAGNESALLQKGLDLESDGQYEQALQTWASAFTKLEIPSLAIGREFIRLATQENLREHYHTASSIYLWGLSAKEIGPNRDALIQELAMLKPLVERQTIRRWEQLFEGNDSDLYRELHNFWQQLDPTPFTQYNERLLEHWERIAYAREHFDRRNDPPYGTDDRGIEYVRYGEPDRKSSGILNLMPGDIEPDCGAFPGCNPEMMREIVMTLNTNPAYEIWSYTKPADEMAYNLVIIFGDKASGGFQRVNVVEDFIPRSAFSLNDQRYAFKSLTGVETSPGTLFTPGMIIQWLYYKKLMSADYFFASRFSELAFEWDVGESPAGVVRLGKFQGPMQEQRSQTKTLINLNNAPEEISTYEKDFPSIPLQVFHYRLLDEQRRPVTATFLESRPGQVFLDDLAFNEEVLFPHDTTTAEEALGYYELSHGLVFTSETGEVLTRSVVPAELILDFQEDLPSSTVFTVPQSENGRQLTFYAELYNRHPDSAPRLGDTPFPQALRGRGKLESELPEPLSTDPATLEMADLVLGWQMRENAPEGTLFPFVVANHREIPEGEELAVHLEIYNLQRGVDGFTDFRIDYEVQPVRRMEWLRGREQEFSLTLDQRTTQTRFTENLEIRTRELPPGRYRLRLAATDKLSGQQMEREIEFRVVETVEREAVSVN